jgi:hypothetical protein
LAEIKDENMPCGVAVDSKGNVFVTEYAGKAAVRFKAKGYPPSKGATYEAREVVHAVEPAKSNGGICTNAWGVAVDPSNDHVYVSVSCEGIFEYNSVANGGAFLDKHEVAIGDGGRSGFAVYGRNHDIYVNAVKPGVKGTAEENPANARVFIFDGASDALQCETDGSETPQEGFGFKFGSAGIAVDQSTGDIYVDDVNETSGHKAVDRFDSECKYIGQIEHSFKPLDIATVGAALAYDAPCLDALNEPCGGKIGYDSPNKGHLYVGQGTLKPNTFWMYAFGAGSSPSFALTVTKAGSGTGKVTSSPAGIDCGSDCEEAYTEGTKVKLTATPEGGSTFAGWSGSGCSGTGSCEVTMSEAKAVSASFEEKVVVPSFALKVALEGTGTGTVTSNPGLISCSPFCEDEFETGTIVTLTASPKPGSLFMGWKHCDSGGVNGRQCMVTMSKAKEVGAVFVTAHDLTVAKAEGSGPGAIQVYGGLTCPNGCVAASAAFMEGAAITVKQTPAKHFHFAGFSGDCSGTGACELSMGKDHEVIANFAEDTKFSISLTKDGGGQALIKTKPTNINCGFNCTTAQASFYTGEVVVVSWKLNKGTTSLNWTTSAGTCKGETKALEGTCEVTVSKNTPLQAGLE